MTGGDQKVTIIEAVKKAMQLHGEPMTAKEAYEAVIAKNLYVFHAQNPLQVATIQIRRHTLGIDFSSATPTKHFQLVGANRFIPLPSPILVKAKSAGRKKTPSRTLPQVKPSMDLASIAQSIRMLQIQYIERFRERLLSALRQLNPREFEIFAGRLIKEYGFNSVTVTRHSKDGGIDGQGTLKVGLASLRVAFQCKRWTRKNIGRTEIDLFRGAIQGEFEQGIFFTTATFTRDAIGASIRRGAVPIVLINGLGIVDMMIERNWGVELERLDLPTYALDSVL